MRFRTRPFPVLLHLGVFFAICGAHSPAASEPEIPVSSSPLLTISNNGVTPLELHIKKKDAVVFFLNTSPDALVTLAINYGTQRTHCANALLDIGDDNIVRSNAPLGQYDFVSSCFPDRGRYPVTIQGLPNFPEGLNSAIVVE